jgi:hypothetical protein
MTIKIRKESAKMKRSSFSKQRVSLIVCLISMLLAVAGTTEAANHWYQCNPPTHIGLFNDRLHVFCTTTTPIAGAPALNPAIAWFAVPTSPDSAAASRFMSLWQTSVLSLKPIWLFLDPSDTSGTTFGCAAADCRRVIGTEMR